MLLVSPTRRALPDEAPSSDLLNDGVERAAERPDTEGLGGVAEVALLRLQRPGLGLQLDEAGHAVGAEEGEVGPSRTKRTARASVLQHRPAKTPSGRPQ